MHTDFVADHEEITADTSQGDVITVTMHDGGILKLRKTANNYDPRDRAQAIETLLLGDKSGEIRTGLLYVNDDMPDMHAANHLPKTPLNALPYEALSPGKAALAKLQGRWR